MHCLGICDSNLKLVDVNIGMPGRMHDANIYKNSPIYSKLNDKDAPLLNPQHHLMGDNAYPNSNFMVTPYRNSGNLTYAQLRYNTILSSVRQVIERCFGLLKGKFRRLKYLDTDSHHSANDIIAACCVLYNFIIEMEGHEDAEDIVISEEYENNDDEEYANVIETDKRLLFTTYFQ